MTSVLIRSGEDKETEGRKPHEDGGRDWNDAAMSQGTLGGTRSGKRQEGYYPRGFGGSVTLAASSFQTSDLQNCE